MSEPTAPEPSLEPGVRTELEGAADLRPLPRARRLLGCQTPGLGQPRRDAVHRDPPGDRALAQARWSTSCARRARGSRPTTSQPAFKMLARVSRIQAQLIQSWDVLSTLTPADYLAFRDRLGPASGLQSHQYRLLEFLLGNKQAGDARGASPHPGGPRRARRRAGAPEPLRRGAAAAGAARLGDRARARRARLAAALRGRPERARRPGARSTAEPARHWDLYELAEELVDLEDWFRQWRFRHVTTVERIIGHKTGTGGSAGVGYLKRALDVCCFPELWQVRTEL